MDTATAVVIIVLIVALMFFGFTMFGNNSGNAQSVKTSYPSSGQYGAGCGR